MDNLQIPKTIASFIDVVNAHDEQGFLDAFTSEGVVDDWGREFAGREAIKAWSDKEFIGATGTITPEEVTEDGDRVTVIGDWRSTHANGRSSFAFDLDGDRIAKMTIREG
ncbi:nuclear transport factor 2 family protein [Brevibacterium spongiae]|uniref:Nuclear transport factor 2 family protein n=1 Tax=Brevibacterium spongiae TaxID=2909672 RepID=A0ABY5SSV4_9MICO|nr:nuclear transport factor 2 family protein [Brevibacterium spongiae]UVI36111.1 nuclear transport factor 2 family protein [Brevibacterium spongiae]